MVAGFFDKPVRHLPRFSGDAPERNTPEFDRIFFTGLAFDRDGAVFEQAGMEGSQGFALLPPAALISVAINLLGGWLSDRMQLRWFLAIMLMAMATYMTGFIFLRPGWVVWLIISSFGLSNGLFGILMTVTWPRYYGREHLGAISGLCMTLMVIFSAVGPAFFSTILKYTRSYSAGFAVCLFAAFILLCASFRAGNPQHH